KKASGKKAGGQTCYQALYAGRIGKTRYSVLIPGCNKLGRTQSVQ
ncbi:hypothetical protein PSYJA_43551, partial [Pseudomonas syringae pv. japonica str. M301072]